MDGSGGLFVGVVAGADEGAGFDDGEAEVKGCCFPVGELFRGYPAINGQVFAGGLQILPQGEDVHIDSANIFQRLLEFLIGFADAEH